MNNERIDLTQFEGMSEGKWEHDGGAIYAEEAERNNPIIAEYPSWNYNVKDNDGLLTVEDHCNLIAMAAVPDLIAELKRCYEELDRLPTRREMSEIHDYTKWLETVESYFLADGSFNQDADFVRKCAVNDKYGYRIEVIDGVETVVHESEY